MANASSSACALDEHAASCTSKGSPYHFSSQLVRASVAKRWRRAKTACGRVCRLSREHARSDGPAAATRRCSQARVGRGCVGSPRPIGVARQPTCAAAGAVKRSQELRGAGSQAAITVAVIRDRLDAHVGSITMRPSPSQPLISAPSTGYEPEARPARRQGRYRSDDQRPLTRRHL
jgi:hypothetical protein